MNNSSQGVVIYHNPRCSKSRICLSLLQEAGIAPDIRLYLEDVPSKRELRLVLDKLGLAPSDILRKSEEAYKAFFTDVADEEALLSLLTQHPKVIERPIVITDDKAAIGRPPEAVMALFTKS